IYEYNCAHHLYLRELHSIFLIMHAQRCPVAKLLAASQQNQSLKGKIPNYNSPPIDSHLPRRSQGAMNDILPNKGKLRPPTKVQQAKGQEKPSFFQRLHGDSVPLLPPCPQMYSDENWTQNLRAKKSVACQKEQVISKNTLCGPSLVFNENCSIHGPHAVKKASHRYAFPKSISCPTPARFDSRQTANAERLKNWRRNSLTINGIGVGGGGMNDNKTDFARRKSTVHHLSSFHQKKHFEGPAPPASSSLCASPSSDMSSPSARSLVKNDERENLQNRRSQFKRAWTFFSMGCDEVQKGKPTPQRILRQPTRYVYRRGISGLPVECTNRNMGVAF
ncbi:hypothetical protein SK128_019889, partial [Halocaridina rubra]